MGFDMHMAKRILASAFRMKATETLKENELVTILAMAKKWFTPQEARTFIAICQKAGLLGTKDGTTLSPTFDMRSVEVPLDFTVSKENVLTEEGIEELKDEERELVAEEESSKGEEKSEEEEEKSPPSYEELLIRIVQDTADRMNVEKKEINREIRKLMDSLLIDRLVAALLVAEMKGLNTSEYHNDVERVLLEGD